MDRLAKAFSHLHQALDELEHWLRELPRNEPSPPPPPARPPPAKEPNKQRLVKIKEACTYAKVSKSRLHELLAAGKIHAYKSGRATLIDLKSIDDYYASLPRQEPRGQDQP